MRARNPCEGAFGTLSRSASIIAHQIVPESSPATSTNKGPCSPANDKYALWEKVTEASSAGNDRSPHYAHAFAPRRRFV